MAAGGTTFTNAGVLINNAYLDSLPGSQWVMPEYMKTATVGTSNLSTTKHMFTFNQKQDAYFNELKRQYESISRDINRLFNVKAIDITRVAELMGYGMWRLKTNPSYLANTTEQPKLDDITQQFLERTKSKLVLVRVINDIAALQKNYRLYFYPDLLSGLANIYNKMDGGRRKTKKLNKRRRKYTRK